MGKMEITRDNVGREVYTISRYGPYLNITSQLQLSLVAFS
jgi:hypothetical protein